jgi:hypothetical protein
MKNLIFILIIVLLSSLQTKAQTNPDNGFVEAKFVVRGVCGMCKERIESTLDVKGVKYAEWNRMTDTLFVVFKPSKITLEQMHDLLAAAGHDTELKKATDEAYRKIDECCRYRQLEKH